MDQVDSEDEIYFRMIEQCKICMTKFWYTMDKWDFTDLSEIEADSILGVQNCLVYFLRNPKTFDNKIDNSSPILVLFKELTGSSATLKDITKEGGSYQQAQENMQKEIDSLKKQSNTNSGAIINNMLDGININTFK